MTAYLPADPNNDGLLIDRGAYEEQCYCAGDLNDTNNVDISDLALMLGCFGSPCTAGVACCNADLDCDNIVGLPDLTIVLSHFGFNCCAVTNGFAGGESGAASSETSDDDALTQWILSATVEELLEWYHAGMPR